MSYRYWGCRRGVRAQCESRGVRFGFRMGWARLRTQQVTLLFSATLSMACKRKPMRPTHAKVRFASCQHEQSLGRQQKPIPKCVRHKSRDSSSVFGFDPLLQHRCKQSCQQKQRKEMSVEADPSSKLIQKGRGIAPVRKIAKPEAFRSRLQVNEINSH